MKKQYIVQFQQLLNMDIIMLCGRAADHWQLFIQVPTYRAHPCSVTTNDWL